MFNAEKILQDNVVVLGVGTKTKTEED